MANSSLTLSSSLFSKKELRQAKKIVRKRIYSLHAESIRKRGVVGALSGLLGGLAWTFSIGTLIIFVIFIANGEREFKFTYLLGLIYFLVSSLFLGPWLGWRIALIGTKNALQNQEGNWAKDINCFSSLVIFPIIIAGIVTPLSYLGNTWENRTTILVNEIYYFFAIVFFSWFFAIILRWILSKMVNSCRLIIYQEKSEIKTWLWVMLCSLGIPFALLFSIWGLLFYLLGTVSNNGKWMESSIVVSIFFATKFSFLFFIFMISLGRSHKAYSLTTAKLLLKINPKKRIQQGLAIVCVVGILSWLHCIYDLTDSSPLWPRVHQIVSCDNETLSFKLGPGWSDSHECFP